MQAKRLNQKEIEKIEKILRKNYGAKIRLKATLFKSSKGKIWMASKEAFSLVSKLRLNSIGLYFGKLKKNEKIQLSVEGSQLIGKKANKNIASIDEENLEKYLHGLNFSAEKLINCEVNNFVLLRFKQDFIGCGILREGYIENILPKARRIFTKLKKI